MQSIHDYAISKAEKFLSDSSKLDLFKKLLNGSKNNVGLLLNERLINIPDEVVPDMHGHLDSDLDFTRQQDDIEDPKEFNYDYLLVISKFAVKSDGSFSTKPTRKDRMYYKWEDDVFD